MFFKLLCTEPELTEADHIVTNPVFPGIVIGHAKGSVKAVHPSKEGQAKSSGPRVVGTSDGCSPLHRQNPETLG